MENENTFEVKKNPLPNNINAKTSAEVLMLPIILHRVQSNNYWYTTTLFLHFTTLQHLLIIFL